MVIPCLVGLCMFCKRQACSKGCPSPLSMQPRILCCLSDCLCLRFYLNTPEKAPSPFVFPWNVPIPLATFAIRNNNISSVLYPLQTKFLHFPSHSGGTQVPLTLLINHNKSQRRDLGSGLFIEDTKKPSSPSIFSRNYPEGKSSIYAGQKFLGNHQF